MRLRFLPLLTLILALSLTASAADRSHNIFDDDWTPPKPSATPRPPKTVTPPAPKPEDPATKIIPPTVAPKETAPVPPPTVAPSARLAVPTSAAQAAVRKVMKEVFAEQLADRSIPARHKLTTALLAQADKSNDALVDQFVLLAAAIDSAVDAVDLPAAIRAADKMSEKFEVDGLEVKADAALRIGSKSASIDQAVENVSAAIELSDELAKVDEYVVAIRVCSTIQPQADSNPALRTELQQQLRDLNAQRDAAERFNRELAKLSTSPDDPAANLAAGKYICFMKSDWENGLPMLAKGSDPILKAPAISELSKPAIPDEIILLADAWWDAADKQADLRSRAGLASHAAELYASVVEKIPGLRRVQIEKRISKATDLSAAASGKPVINLLKFIDVKKDSAGNPWKNIGDSSSIESPPGGLSKLSIRYQPPEEYDFRIEFTRKSGDPGLVQIFTYAKHRCAWALGWQNRDNGFETVAGHDAASNPSTVKGPTIPAIGTRYTSVVKVRKGRISAYLNGKLVTVYKTDGSDLDVPARWNIGEMQLGLGTGYNDTVFHVVELREIKGHGKPIR